jgi:hypothetical protein
MNQVERRPKLGSSEAQGSLTFKALTLNAGHAKRGWRVYWHVKLLE